MNGFDCLAENSVIPLRIADNDDNNCVIEIIICDSIAGGARYENDMPIDLHLTRILADGTRYQMRYIQILSD